MAHNIISNRDEGTLNICLEIKQEKYAASFGNISLSRETTVHLMTNVI